jgi:hypothetical protein
MTALTQQITIFAPGYRVTHTSPLLSDLHGRVLGMAEEIGQERKVLVRWKYPIDGSISGPPVAYMNAGDIRKD